MVGFGKMVIGEIVYSIAVVSYIQEAIGLTWENIKEAGTKENSPTEAVRQTDGFQDWSVTHKKRLSIFHPKCNIYTKLKLWTRGTRWYHT